MTAMHKPRTAAAVLIAALLVLGLRAEMRVCEVAVVAAPRHNIVVVLADDLDVRLFERVPRLRDLRGRRYVNAFVVSPLCCPSRASFLTGMYPHNHGVLDNEGPNGGIEAYARSGRAGCDLPVWLQRAGYETAYIGKYLNGYGTATEAAHIPPGWNNWQGLPIDNRYEGYLMNDNGRLVWPEKEQTAELADRAVRYLDSAIAPFFLMVAPFAPHRPSLGDLPRGNWNPAYQRGLGDRLASLVDRVADSLPPNTLMIVTSDNGYHWEPYAGKELPYDTDTRVPLVIVGLEGIDERLAPNIDVTATIAEWAGVRIPMDGQSLFAQERSSVLIELHGWQATRTHEELTIRWADGRVEVSTTGCPDSRPC
jgi:arylsulfatase A-like enzyme